MSIDNKEIEEIDFIGFIGLIKQVWEKRVLIIKVTSVFILIGVIIAIICPKEYTTEINIVPQVTDNKPKIGGSLAGSAAMVVLNLGDMSGTDVLSPLIYPKILGSAPFQKDLMYKKIKFEGIAEPITLYDYYSNDKYKKSSFGGIIFKYTIGLPQLILKSIKRKSSSDTDNLEIHFLKLTSEEKIIADLISEKVQISIDEKIGVISITATMPEALASAQTAQNTMELLQKYITRFKIDKVQSNLDYIEERYFEAQSSYKTKQKELAYFMDANQNILTATAKTQQEMLNNEYTLLFTVYTDLAKQYEQAKIKVKETTPILTIIEPAVIPNERSKPKRSLIVLIFGFIGISVAIGFIFLIPVFNSLKKRIRSFLRSVYFQKLFE